MSKLRRKTFTIVEQACHEIHGFRKLFQELQDKIVLSEQSRSTLNNYARKLAQVSLHFGKLPQHMSEKEINRYLASLACKSKTPSSSDFKLTDLCPYCKQGKIITIERFDPGRGPLLNLYNQQAATGKYRQIVTSS